MFAYMLRIIFLLILINLSFIFMHSFGIHMLIDYPSGWWQLKTVVRTCNVYLVGGCEMCRIPNFMEYILYISDVDLNVMHIYYLFLCQKIG